MKLYAGGYLAFYLPGRETTLELNLDQPQALAEVLAGLGIPLAEVFLVAVNNEQADLQAAIVNQDDEVRIFSAVNGG